MTRSTGRFGRVLAEKQVNHRGTFVYLAIPGQDARVELDMTEAEDFAARLTEIVESEYASPEVPS